RSCGSLTDPSERSAAATDMAGAARDGCRGASGWEGGSMGEPAVPPMSSGQDRQRLERLPAGVDRLCDLDDRLRRPGSGIGEDERLALVTAFAQTRVERHPTEQRDADLLG